MTHTMIDGLSIAAEILDDHAAVHEVVVAAFPTDAEARLVTALRQTGRADISLVARLSGAVVGHLFSPVTIEADYSEPFRSL